MIRIGICDDEQEVCNGLDKIICKYMEDNNLEYDVEVYYSADYLCPKINEGKKFDILFLDIEMEGLNGVEFGQIIRDGLEDEQTKIIYISWNKSYAYDLYDIRPFNFIIKPLNEEKIGEVLDKAINIIKREDMFFYLKKGKKTVKILLSDILYFQSMRRKIVLCTIEGEIEYYDNLDDIHKKVDKRYFWRIHKSYIINCQRVSIYEYEKMIMDNGEEVSISPPNRTKVRDLYRNYLRKEL